MFVWPQKIPFDNQDWSCQDVRTCQVGNSQLDFFMQFSVPFRLLLLAWTSCVLLLGPLFSMSGRPAAIELTTATPASDGIEDITPQVSDQRGRNGRRAKVNLADSRFALSIGSGAFLRSLLNESEMWINQPGDAYGRVAEKLQVEGAARHFVDKTALFPISKANSKACFHVHSSLKTAA